MKFVIVFVAILAFAFAYEVELTTEEEWENVTEDKNITPEDRGLILGATARKVLRNVLDTLPCGWPEYGIPPLAPYTNENLEVHLAKSVVDSLLQLIRLRFDGLDQMKIRKLKVSYTFKKKVRFHFAFNELRAEAAALNTDTFIDFLKELGISVRYEGSGPMKFALHNLELQGQFKYKMPILWGSIKIYNFECLVSLGSVRSNIGGILGNGALNQLINDEIELAIPAIINGNQYLISDRIEDIVVPFVNNRMKGHKVWYILHILSESSSNCIPEPPPWF